MKVRVYSHNAFDLAKEKVTPEMYVELDLADYTRKDIERVGGEHFTACGKNCYLVVDFIPENAKDEQAVHIFRWHKWSHKHWYTLQANYALKYEGDNKYRILPHVNEETMNDLDKCLTEDRKAYLEWLKNN